VSFARLAMTAVALSLIVAPSASAESKWTFKKLVPSFGKKDEPLRGLYPEPKEPSLWQKMNRGTKSVFAKSKDAVPSWLMPRSQDRVRRSAGSLKKSDDRMRGEVRTAQRNFFAPWAKKPEPIRRPETVSDFLGQPRPE
jgi:hypothetical protein